MRFEGDYAIIETVEEARFFYVENAFADYGIGKIARAQVLEAITPKEGDAVFWWEESLDETPPEYHPWGAIQFDGSEIKANALTIGKTVGELRELLIWCTP